MTTARPRPPVKRSDALASFTDVYSPTGASILMFEPSGTSSTGDRHGGDIPGHVDSTVGREL